MKYTLTLLLVLAVFLTSATLGTLNNNQVHLNYIFSQGEYKISSLLEVFLCTGFFLGWLICGIFWLRTGLALRSSNKKIQSLKHQLESLKLSSKIQ